MELKDFLGEITKYLNLKHAPEQHFPALKRFDALKADSDDIAIKGLLSNLDEPFSQTFLRFIDYKKMTDADVYRRANIDRRLFAKIRRPDYRPSKQTVLALAIALELDLDETKLLLERAGFTLSHSQKSDVIIEYFIMRKIYNLHEINSVLYEYDQPILGG